MGSTKTVNTILLGAEILKVLAAGASRLEDIYLKVGLNKSTTHRILKSLARTGLAYQHPLARSYHVGPLFLQVSANTAALHHLLILCASDEMRRLQETTHETALLLIPLGDQRLVLKEIIGDRQISLSHGEGSTMPIMVGSSGRILLSQYDDQTLQKLFSQMDIPAVAPDFMGDPDLRMKEINRIRSEGYALNSGEMVPDSAGISVPIKGYVCPVALSLFGPQFRFDPLTALKEIRKSAKWISEKIKSLLTGTAPASEIKSMRKDMK